MHQLQSHLLPSPLGPLGGCVAHEPLCRLMVTITLPSSLILLPPSLHPFLPSQGPPHLLSTPQMLLPLFLPHHVPTLGHSLLNPLFPCPPKMIYPLPSLPPYAPLDENDPPLHTRSPPQHTQALPVLSHPHRHSPLPHPSRPVRTRGTSSSVAWPHPALALTLFCQMINSVPRLKCRLKTRLSCPR